MKKDFKILILHLILLIGAKMYCQSKPDSVIISTNIEIGTTGHLFFPEWQLSYNNIFKKFYTSNSFEFIKFFPNFTIQVTRNIGKKSFAVGYSINVADLSNEEFVTNKYYISNIYASIQFNPLYESKHLILSPKITAAYCKSTKTKFKVAFGDIPYKVYKETMELGGGIQAKMPIYKNIFLNNSFDLLYHFYWPKLYLRHMITIGYTF